MVSRSRAGFTLNIIDTPGLVEGGYVNDQVLDTIKRSETVAHYWFYYVLLKFYNSLALFCHFLHILRKTYILFVAITFSFLFVVAFWAGSF